jgi:hypothetical protein
MVALEHINIMPLARRLGTVRRARNQVDNAQRGLRPDLASVGITGARSAGKDGEVPTVRFIHTADLQLGMTRRFLDADAQARYAQARIDGLTAIGRMAAAERAAFVVVAGDVFETNRVRPRTVGRALEAMASIPVPVFLLPGNHDPVGYKNSIRQPADVVHG